MKLLSSQLSEASKETLTCMFTLAKKQGDGTLS